MRMQRWTVVLALVGGWAMNGASGQGGGAAPAGPAPSAAPAPGKPAPAPVAAAPAVVGTVRVTGKLKPAAVIKPTQDKVVCGKKPLVDESVLAGAKGVLANAVVWLDGVPGGAVTAAKGVVDQAGCRYLPHVQALPVGSSLTLLNSDATLHNVHGYLGDDTLFNVGMPMKGVKSTQVLEQPGVVTLGCDAGHTWMRAYVVVFAHRYYAVTGKDGRFSIGGVPAGTYKVKVWHERLGTVSGSVEVKADGSGSVELALAAK